MRPPVASLDVDELVALYDGGREGPELGGGSVNGRGHDSAAGDRDALLVEGIAAGIDGLLAVADEGEAVGAVVDRGAGEQRAPSLRLGATGFRADRVCRRACAKCHARVLAKGPTHELARYG